MFYVPGIWIQSCMDFHFISVGCRCGFAPFSLASLCSGYTRNPGQQVKCHLFLFSYLQIHIRKLYTVKTTTQIPVANGTHLGAEFT